MYSFAKVPKAYWQVFLKLTCLILLIVGMNFAADWVVSALSIELRPTMKN